MAVGARHLTSGYDNTDKSTAYATSSVDFAASSLATLWLTIRTSAAQPTPTITGNSLTWVQIGAEVASTNSFFGYLYAAMSAAPSAGTISIDPNGLTWVGCAWSVIEYTGIDNRYLEVLRAIRNYSTDNGSGGSALTTLSVPFVDTIIEYKNAVAGQISTNVNSDITPGTGFIQISESNGGTPNNSQMNEFRPTNDTDIDATWASASRAVGIGIELVAHPTDLFIRNIYNAGDATNATSYAFNTVPVVAGRLYILTVANWSGAATANTPTVTSSGGETVTAITNASGIVSSVLRTTMYRFRALATGNINLTVATGAQGQLRAAVSVEEVIGEDLGGSNGSAAIVQGGSGTGSSTTPSVTLTNPISHTENFILAAFSTNNNNASIAIDKGYTEIVEIPQVEVAMVTGVGAKKNSQTVSWTQGSAAWSTAGIEIKKGFSDLPNNYKNVRVDDGLSTGEKVR